MIGASANRLSAVAQIARSRTIRRSRRMSPAIMAKTERLLLIGKVVVAAKEHDLPRPGLFKAQPVHDQLGVFPRFRILQDHGGRFVASLERLEDHASAARQRHHDGKGLLQMGQAAPAHRTRLAFSPACAAQ